MLTEKQAIEIEKRVSARMFVIVTAVGFTVNYALLMAPWEYNIVHSTDPTFILFLKNMWYYSAFTNIIIFFMLGGSRAIDLLLGIILGPIVTISTLLLIISIRVKPVDIGNEDERAQS